MPSVFSPFYTKDTHKSCSKLRFIKIMNRKLCTFNLYLCYRSNATRFHAKPLSNNYTKNHDPLGPASSSSPPSPSFFCRLDRKYSPKVLLKLLALVNLDQLLAGSVPVSNDLLTCSSSPFFADGVPASFSFSFRDWVDR